jgi:hypothetical protein
VVRRVVKDVPTEVAMSKENRPGTSDSHHQPAQSRSYRLARLNWPAPRETA